MSRLTDFFQQLGKRRVIRAAVLYAAGLWLLLQVADLLAQAGMVSDDFVRWMILLGLIFFPVTLALTWLFEHPWHGRPWLAMAGDIAMLLIVSLAAGLLAHEQWTKSFTRPVVAVLILEPTDAQPDTGDLANHLASRFRMLLATIPEMRVLELSSSQHPSLAALPVREKAELLQADYLLAGTVNQSRKNLRASIQLFDAGGKLLWSDRFSDRLINQQALQYSIMAAAWPALGLDESRLLQIRELIRGCVYPADENIVKAIAKLEGRLGGRETYGLQDYERMVSELDALIAGTEEKGLLHLLRARSRWQSLKRSPANKKTVLQRLVMQDLEDLVYLCPSHSDARLYRLRYTRALERQDIDAANRLFNVQELIASDVARELGGSAGQQKVQETIAQRCEMPADPAVLEKYYTARYHIEKRAGGTETLYTAVSLYQELIEADPDFAEARSGLAWAYLFINTYDETLDGREKQENDRKSMEQARQAFALCEHLGEAMVILPNQYDHPNRWINGYQNLAAAIEMQPNQLMLHDHFNRHLVDAGRKSDSRESVRNTYLMNPLSVRAVRSYAMALMEPETMDEAVRMFERAAELGREGPNFAAQMKKTYACQKDVECFVENLPPPFQPYKEQMRVVFTVPENAEQLDGSLSAARELLKEQPWMINLFNASACWNEHLTPIFFDAYETEAYWFWPNVWIHDCGRVHRLQEFKDLVEEAGLVEYWRQFGWADACRSLGEDDFICDGYPIEESAASEV